MTIDDIIRIAEEVGVHDGGAENWAKGNRYEDFAKACYAAGAAAEREKCAKVCDDLPLPPYVSNNDAHIWDLTCVDCAAAIRARGQYG